MNGDDEFGPQYFNDQPSWFAVTPETHPELDAQPRPVIEEPVRVGYVARVSGITRRILDSFPRLRIKRF